jgi:hypothetical protein
MTTRTKLNIAVWTTSIMMMVNVFSKPLHIPEPIHWALILGVFVPIALTFLFIKQMKEEKAGNAATSSGRSVSQADDRKATRNRLLLMMAIGCLVGLCSPFWLPLTGTTLGTTGDLMVGIITIVVVCAIFGFRLRNI